MARSTKADVEVRIFGNITDFAQKMNKAKWEAMSFQKKLLATSGIMKNFGRNMSMGVTLPIVAGMGLAVKAAMEENAAMAQLSKALKNNAQASDAQVASVEEWITATQNATGILDDELRPAMANLVRATGDVTRSQRFMQTAMDISAAKGKPLEQVTMAIAKAYNGNVGALGRLGIATKDVQGKQMDFWTAMDGAAKTYGGSAAAAADTTAGKMNILRGKFGDLTESIGNILLPAVTKLVEWLSAMADKFNGMPGWMQKGVVAIGLFAAAVGPAAYLTGQLIQSINAINGAVKAIKASEFVAKMLGFNTAAQTTNTTLATQKMRWQTVAKEAAAYAVAIGLITIAVAETIKAFNEWRDAEKQLQDQRKSAMSNEERQLARVREKYGENSDQYRKMVQAIKEANADLVDSYKSDMTGLAGWLDSWSRGLEDAKWVGGPAGFLMKMFSRAGAGLFDKIGLASGGYVPARSGGTLALLGEGGQGEYVIPERKMGAAGPTFNNCTFSAQSPYEVRDQVLRALNTATASGF